MAAENFKVKKGLEVGTAITATSSGVNVTGVVTATQFVGDGSGLTGVTGSGSGVVIKHDGSAIGTASTINFSTNLDVSAISAGIVTITASGISTIGGAISIADNLDVDGHTELDNLNVSGVSTFTADVELTSTDSGAAAAPTLRLQRDSSSPANQDVLGQIVFGGKDNTPNDENYASVAGKIIQAGAGGEHGAIQITTRKASSNVITANLTSTDYELLNGTNLSVDGDITGNSNFKLTSTDTGSAAAPELTLHRNSSSPANNDYLGEIHFRGKDNAGNSADYATITGKILSTTNGAERGILEFTHLKSGTETVTGRWRDDSLQLLNSTNLSVAGNTTLTGNLDVDGQTDLDDVVVAGVSTFNDGITLGTNSTTFAAKFADDAVANFGTDNDLQISHDNSNALIRNSTGKIVVVGVVSATSGANITGVVTATTFSGSGASLTNLPSGQLSGALPALDGSALTGVTASGSGIVVKHDGTTVGTAGTINFSTNLDVTAVSAGIVTITASGGGSNASTFTVTANNSTDETVYPIFVDGTTGSQGAESDTNLSYNPSSNILTAGTFSGNLSGTVNTAAQTSITSLGTLSALTVSGDVTANGNIVGDNSTNISGIASVTATSFHGSGIGLTSLDADNLGSGVIPNGRFPATLPAANGANLTSLTAGNISGTIAESQIADEAITFAKMQHVGTGVFIGRDSSGSGDIETMTPAEARTLLNVADGATAGITTFQNAAWTVGNNSSSNYVISGPGGLSGANNPDLHLVRGQTYQFIMNASGHGFGIQTVSGSWSSGNEYTTGITNAQADSGTITFAVPYSAPARLYYACTSNHGGMVGNIYIRGAGGHDDKVGITTITGGLLHIKDNTSPAIRLQDNNNVNSDFKIYSPDGANHLRIYHENTSSDLVTITSDGKVGIGTDNPTYKLHIDSGDAAIGLWKSRRSSGSYIDYAVGANGAALGYIGAGGQIIASGADSSDFAIRSQGDLCFAAGGSTERLRIDPYGRVLIGGTSAIIGSSSEFNEIVLTGKTRGAGITLQDVDANVRFQIRTDDDSSGTLGTLLNASTNHDIFFRTNNTERLRIKSTGQREIRNYHYGPWAFTNNTAKTTITVGDPGDNKFTTIKLILTLNDGSYRQNLWQGEYTIFASNAAGGPGVNYYLKEHWQHVGSGNWSGGTVSVAITSGGALQVTADNGHDDAAGNAYIHILDVIGDIDGSTVASISS